MILQLNKLTFIFQKLRTKDVVGMGHNQEVMIFFYEEHQGSGLCSTTMLNEHVIIIYIDF